MRFTYTTPGVGGQRAWFLCPNCSRRCRIVYGGYPFACRLCLNLAYRTCQESRLDARVTAIRNRRHRIEERLGYDTDKPTRMWGRTYLRRLCQLLHLRELEML